MSCVVGMFMARAKKWKMVIAEGDVGVKGE